MPCHDVPERMEEATQTMIYTHDNTQQNHHTDADFCSPLCCCACCGSVLISPYFYQSAAVLSIHDRTKFLSEIKATSSFSSLLWQPPQLG